MSEGLVTRSSAFEVYGVALQDSSADFLVDAEATALQRDLLRHRRIGRTPKPPAPSVPGTRFTWNFNLHQGRLVCRRCATAVASSGEDLYRRLHVSEVPTVRTAPLGLRFSGAERFVLRTCFCPACGRQVDVQVSLADEPLMAAFEPLSD
jgi:hypothetical protein